MPQRKYEGVTFASVRFALTALYWYDKNTPEDESWVEKQKYVVPMQHNWENPIKAETGDTYIQYWIDRDDRLSQDYNDGNVETVHKVADITLRFIGARGEQWAKAFHHLTKRGVVGEVFGDICNGGMLEYVRPIVPVNVDYFKTGNTAIAFETGFSIEYDEYLDLSDLREPLEYISFPAGVLQ